MKVIIKCANCGSNLTEQVGFDSKIYMWTCTSCNKLNKINQSNEIIKSHSSTSSSPNESSVKINRKILQFSTIALLIIGLIAYFRISSIVTIPYNCDYFLHTNYESTKNILEDCGFKNIDMDIVDDLLENESSENEQVTSVTIDGISTFSANQQFDENVPIVVTYHIYRQVKVPLSSKKCKNGSALEIKKQFEDAGFTNIKMEKINDVVFGIMTSNKEIESITIDGKDRFYNGEKFDYFAEVKIAYHTYILG